MVTNRSTHLDRKKRDGLKKVLDKLVEAEYNESIKSEEWFLAHNNSIPTSLFIMLKQWDRLGQQYHASLFIMLKQHGR